MPRSLQAALILLHVLFVATLVGAIRALSTASSVDAVDGYLLGLLLYASLPGVAVFVLSLYVRHGGVRAWYGLLAVLAWIVLGALAELSGGGAEGQGVARLAVPVAVIVLLCRPESRRWFRSGLEQRAEQRLFSFARMMRLRRDGGQTALEYLGLVLVVVALVGGLMATGTGQQLTAEIRSAICELTGSSCPAPGRDVAAGGGSGDGGADGGGDRDTSSSGADGMSGEGESSLTGGTGSTGTTGENATSGTSGTTATAGSPGDTATTGSPGDTATTGAPNTPQGSTPFPQGDFIAPVDAGRPAGPHGGGFIGGFLGDGVGGDVRGVVGAVLRPGETGQRIADQWARDTRGAEQKWARGDYIGAAWDWNKAVGGAGAGLAIPGSGARVDAEVRDAERAHLGERIPQNATPAQRKAWWDGLSPEERERYIELLPERIGNLDGIPVLAR
ncbi:hypothetical protein G3M53_47885, partial [Streptomyces sp. SID7982]|nr:hypothetical protein [Streptomyces sp. SID7982]